MRIYVVEPLGKGGLLHYSYQLCRGLKRVGADVTLITATTHELESLEHEFPVLKFLKLWDPRTAKSSNPLLRKLQRAWRGVIYIWEWLRLVRFLKRERPDVVLLGEIRFGFEYYFLRMLARQGIHLADIVHDVRPYSSNRQSTAILVEDEQAQARYNRIYQLFSALFVHDKSNHDLFISLYDIPIERVHQIVHATSELMLEVPQQYTAQELRAYLHIPEGQSIVLFFGTLTRYKGIEDLVTAFPQVVSSLPAHLVIAGFPAKDIDLDSLKQRAVSLNIADHITWYPHYIPNEWVATLMELSDVVVLPYRAITQSGILQITYACGKPIVATRVGGLPDVIHEGETGFLAEPRDPSSLAEAIIRALQDPEKTRQMGENARRIAETQYTWVSVANRIKTILEQLPSSSHK